MALLAFPTHYASRLSPDASELFEFLGVHIVVLTVGCSVPRVAGGPLAAFGWVAWTLGASDMAARFAGGCCGGYKEGVALVAGAADALCGGLVGELVAVPGGDSQELLLLRLVSSLCGFDLLARCLFLGVSWALLAALVLALHAHLIVAVESAAAVAAAVHAHADGLLYTRNQGGRVRGDDPVLRLEAQAIPGEECASALPLHSIAVEGYGGGNRSRGRRRCGCLDAGGGSEDISSRTMRTISCQVST